MDEAADLEARELINYFVTVVIEVCHPYLFYRILLANRV